MLSSSIKYLVFLLWVGAVYFIGIGIFTSGFLLRRQVLPNRTECGDGQGCNQPPAVFQKAVILLIDALKYDFCLHNESLLSPKPYQNKLPVLQTLSKPDPTSGLAHGKLFKFLADPPTTTMQRLKGLTTGSLPTFIDMASNFGSHEITEDNLLDQLVGSGKRVVFAGDDTWTSLYPSSFTRSSPLPSFDVWDLDTVDREVAKVLTMELRNPRNWDVFIGHFLGVDHAGHKFGPNHDEMGRKLGEMNSVIEKVARSLPQDTLLLVFGDHGMTSDGDHGGDSPSELEAGMFAYSPSLGLHTSPSPPSVAQIDLVPSLSLLLGVPIPFSSLGSIIEDLFLPSSLLSSSPKHARQATYSQENLVNFRLSYIKSNVHQVYRYLTAYIAAGGSFPEAANSRVRSLASLVLNRPGALSTRQVVDLYNSCKIFLEEAKGMCQSVWVDFNLTAMGHGLNILFLHTSVLLILVLKPTNRMLSHLVSSSLLLTLGIGLALGGFLGLTLAMVTGHSAHLWVPGLAVSLSVVIQGFSLLWKLRQSLVEIVHGLVGAFNVQAGFLSLLFLATLVLSFSNSFVVLSAPVLSFLAASLLASYILRFRNTPNPLLPCLSVLACLGLLKLASIYVRCREEQGPECTQTDFHKPLSTLPAEAGQSYKNWRYFFTLLSLGLTCALLNRILVGGGNLNGISFPVLVARYFPWFLSFLVAGYWALQSFPIALVSKLLPWQQNLLAHCVYGLSLLGVMVLLASPRLLYLDIPRKRRLGGMVPKQDSVSTYFNYMKTNWKTALGSNSPSPVSLAYGLGTAISAVILSITFLVALMSMLIAGDGQCPAVALHLFTCGLALLATTPLRLRQVSNVSSLFSVPFSVTLLWFLLDCLAFYHTGHQPTFPHIQWAAAFVGFAGTEFGGDTWLGHLVPITLVGWNTFATTLLSGLALPLLLIAPLSLWLHIPALRPAPVVLEDSPALLGEDPHQELAKGEAVLLDRVEEARAAALILCCQYLVLRAAKLFACVLSAAVLRRHLMVWKIFAPNFIFEAISFCVSFVAVTLGFLVFNRVLTSLSNWYTKIQKT